MYCSVFDPTQKNYLENHRARSKTENIQSESHLDNEKRGCPCVNYDAFEHLKPITGKSGKNYRKMDANKAGKNDEK